MLLRRNCLALATWKSDDTEYDGGMVVVMQLVVVVVVLCWWTGGGREWLWLRWLCRLIMAKMWILGEERKLYLTMQWIIYFIAMFQFQRPPDAISYWNCTHKWQRKYIYMEIKRLSGKETAEAYHIHSGARPRNKTINCLHRLPYVSHLCRVIRIKYTPASPISSRHLALDTFMTFDL